MRLERVGLLKRSKGALAWKIPSELVRSPDGIASSAVREFHHQILSKAQHALDTVALENRDFSALVLALTPDALADARHRIRNFLAQLHEELSEKPNGADAEVYSVSVQCFPLTQTQKERE